jgi:hypothetical protein
VLLLFALRRSDGSYSGNPGSGGGNAPPGADMDISAAELVNRLSFHVSCRAYCEDGVLLRGDCSTVR